MHLVITDVLVPSVAFDDWLADLALPHLNKLLATAEFVEDETPIADVQRTMPATRFLAQALGVQASIDTAPVAAADRAARGLSVENGWWIADPVHFALARDHVQLGDHAPSLTADEANALADTARAIVEEGGGTLETPSPTRWHLRHPELIDLNAGEPLRALGRNIDLWLPDGAHDATRAWRRLHTEIQMSWHAHPVNEAREAAGLPTINALWLWGGDTPIKSGEIAQVVVKDAPPSLARDFAALARQLGVHTSKGAPSLRVHDELALHAAREDVIAWRTALATLDANHLAPLAAAGKPVMLTLCGETLWRTYCCNPRQHWRFWRRSSLRQRLSV
ncbi:MAG TPA: hypothetical protein VFS42_05625 [Burkholderiaceae bacterium]|nr:hypothetical protein [Burkholderiaceae bacterium]